MGIYVVELPVLPISHWYVNVYPEPTPVLCVCLRVHVQVCLCQLKLAFEGFVGVSAVPCLFPAESSWIAFMIVLRIRTVGCKRFFRVLWLQQSQKQLFMSLLWKSII